MQWTESHFEPPRTSDSKFAVALSARERREQIESRLLCQAGRPSPGTAPLGYAEGQGLTIEGRSGMQVIDFVHWLTRRLRATRAVVMRTGLRSFVHSKTTPVSAVVAIYPIS